MKQLSQPAAKRFLKAPAASDEPDSLGLEGDDGSDETKSWVAWRKGARSTMRRSSATYDECGVGVGVGLSANTLCHEPTRIRTS